MTEVKQSAAESGAGWLLDSQGGAHSTVGQSSVTAAGTSVGETHRVAFLVRKAGESGSGGSGTGGASAVKSGSSGVGGLGGGVGRYMGSGMWSSLGMRGIGGGSSENPSSGSGGGGDEGNGATGMGGFGVDARKYVEGLLSLNR
jgi:hypothetical protein